MSPLEYQRDLLRQVNEKRMGSMLNRINYLKGRVKEPMQLPEPINYDNATAQLSILEEIYSLEEELGLHKEEIRFDELGIGVRDE